VPQASAAVAIRPPCADFDDDALDRWFDGIAIRTALRFDGDSDAPVAMEVEQIRSNLVALIEPARSQKCSSEL
jgi:hypothetical protein